jgi:CheY-like chemotaxis protein
MSLQLKRHVYIVDDEHVIAHTLAAILNGCGFEATAFTNPLNALKESVMGKPDLLISDVMMPGMNGVELGIQFRNSLPQCKVLLFSGQATNAPLLEGAQARGYDFTLLAKPIHPKDLLAAIGQALN